jgi:hypothetical protein
VSGVHANFEALEGTVTTATTLTLVRKSRRIVITNDSSSNDMTYKFNASETAGTLKPTETISLDFTTNQIIIDSANAPYRVWVYG